MLATNFFRVLGLYTPFNKYLMGEKVLKNEFGSFSTFFFIKLKKKSCNSSSRPFFKSLSHTHIHTHSHTHTHTHQLLQRRKLVYIVSYSSKLYFFDALIFNAFVVTDDYFALI